MWAAGPCPCCVRGQDGGDLRQQGARRPKFLARPQVESYADVAARDTWSPAIDKTDPFRAGAVAGLLARQTFRRRLTPLMLSLFSRETTASTPQGPLKDFCVVAGADEPWHSEVVSKNRNLESYSGDNFRVTSDWRSPYANLFDS